MPCPASLQRGLEKDARDKVRLEDTVMAVPLPITVISVNVTVAEHALNFSFFRVLMATVSTCAAQLTDPREDKDSHPANGNDCWTQMACNVRHIPNGTSACRPRLC